MKILANTVSRCQQLEGVLSQKDRKEEQLLFQMRSLQIAIDKRDAIINSLR
jgi:hypothetical protein